MRRALRRWANLSMAMTVMATTAPAGWAHAQQPQPPAQGVTDSDRLNARDQFGKGIEYQQAGRWADALLAFQRAQALFSAPTNMLHIAECLTQLGRLVEAEETYRGLTLLQLPKDAPPPFFAAQAQGAAELQQVQARIPKMRIEITPANLPNLVITLDSASVNPVLVGADRAIDPGPHVVTAFAPGYGQKEARVTIVEHEPIKVVSLVLQTTGVAYAPGLPAGPGTPPPQPPQPLPPPSAGPPPAYPGPGRVLGPGEAPPPPPLLRPRPSSTGLLLGVRLGLNLMGGGLLPSSPVGNQNASSVSLGDAFATGGVVGLQAALRFARKGYVGVIYEHTFAGGGGDTVSLANYYTGSANGFGGVTSVKTYGNMIAADIGYISNPEGVGIVLDLAAAYRVVGLEAANKAFSASYSGPEVTIGGGVWIAAGPVRIVPRLDLSIGTFTGEAVTCGGAIGGCAVSSSGSIAGAPTHVIAFLGIGGYFSKDFMTKPRY